MKEFGTMEDFDELLEKAHERNMKLIMDLVVNHTSDEHQWFQKALNEPESKYRNYYHFRKDDGTKNYPNNWTSFFSGPAWNYYEDIDKYALHLFSKKQMDLNWDNPKLRENLIDMINWWLEKGVDGFRIDAAKHFDKSVDTNNEILNWLYTECTVLNPDFYMVSEVWEPMVTFEKYYGSQTPSIFNFDAGQQSLRQIQTLPGNTG